MIQPTGKSNNKPCRPFMDREPYLEAFYDALRSKKKDEYKVLVYYGMGGIGKTSLLHELKAYLKKQQDELVWECLDFSLPTNLKSKEGALIFLRNSLRKKFGIEFPTYEIAYGYYIEKIGKTISFETDSFPFLEAGSIVADILSTFGGLSFVGLPFKFISLFQLGKRKFDQWYAGRGKEDLIALEEMEALKILDNLHLYFARDLSEHLTKKSLGAVILIDSYEVLWGTDRIEASAFAKDQWIRDLIQELQEVIWVISSREKLRWEKVDADWQNIIEPQLFLEELSEEDSKRFLTSCGIQGEAALGQIFESSQGVPYYLDLVVDIYEKARKNSYSKPFAEELGKTPGEIFTRFMEYLDRSEIETLKVLSVCRYWDLDLFEHLVFRFNTGYPITAYNSLFMFSFIQKDEGMPDTWTMHQLTRRSLMDHQEEIILTKIRTVLFEYYNERLKNLDTEHITDENRRCFEEAYYHGKMILKIDEFAAWFTGISELFYYPLEWNFMVSYVQEMLGLIEDALATGHPDAGAALHNLNSIGTIVEDMNFDGFDDVRIQAFFPPGPNIPYLYYIWDNNIAKFVSNTDLERISDPRFDHEKKTITSFERGNAVTYYESIYQYINGIPTLIRETEMVGDVERSILRTTIRELKDGEMQIVAEYEEKVDIDSSN